MISKQHTEYYLDNLSRSFQEQIVEFIKLKDLEKWESYIKEEDVEWYSQVHMNKRYEE